MPGPKEGLRSPARRVATYSIVARDDAGWLGVGVQSHWFSVGSVVPWVEPGVGAVAIQSFVDPSHGRRALDLLRSGGDVEAALGVLLDDDESSSYRQVALVDSHGGPAVHTGADCIPEAGHTTGEGFSAQANLMRSDTVWSSMARAFQGAGGDLVGRLLTALEAGEEAGGDIRGRQSAAVLVASAEASGSPTRRYAFDLRVEDHPEPLLELRRLVELRRAYLKLDLGDERVAEGDVEGALDAYQAGAEMLPDSATGGEAAFWTAVAMAAVGRAEARFYMGRALGSSRVWRELIPRLVTSGLLSDESAELLSGAHPLKAD